MKVKRIFTKTPVDSVAPTIAEGDMFVSYGQRYVVTRTRQKRQTRCYWVDSGRRPRRFWEDLESYGAEAKTRMLWDFKEQGCNNDYLPGQTWEHGGYTYALCLAEELDFGWLEPEVNKWGEICP